MATNGWSISDIPAQTGKNIIVTGANSGIGFEAAQTLAGKGAFVTLACRNLERGQQACKNLLKLHAEAKINLMLLDLANLTSVQEFAENYRTEHGRLDMLINNAGVMVPPFEKTADGFELQFGCNHLGHFALTTRLIDLVTQAENGRVVVVSSAAHKIGRINFSNLNAESGYRPWAAYGQSKLANLLFAYELQRRLSSGGFNTLVTAAHPGYASTNLQRSSAPARLGNVLMAQSRLAGALPTLRAATDLTAEPGSYWGPGGFMEMRGEPVRVESNKRSHDKPTAALLWSVSEDLVGLPFSLAH